MDDEEALRNYLQQHQDLVCAHYVVMQLSSIEIKEHQEHVHCNKGKSMELPYAYALLACVVLSITVHVTDDDAV